MTWMGPRDSLTFVAEKTIFSGNKLDSILMVLLATISVQIGQRGSFF
jgi:hypothetical protein